MVYRVALIDTYCHPKPTVEYGPKHERRSIRRVRETFELLSRFIPDPEAVMP